MATPLVPDLAMNIDVDPADVATARGNVSACARKLGRVRRRHLHCDSDHMRGCWFARFFLHLHARAISAFVGRVLGAV